MFDPKSSRKYIIPNQNAARHLRRWPQNTKPNTRYSPPLEPIRSAHLQISSETRRRLPGPLLCNATRVRIHSTCRYCREYLQQGVHLGHSPDRNQLWRRFNHWWLFGGACCGIDSRCDCQMKDEGERRFPVRDPLAGDMARRDPRACRIVDLWIYNAVQGILGGTAHGNG